MSAFIQLSRTEKLTRLLNIASSRNNYSAKIDLLAAIAGFEPKINEHKDIAEAAAKGFVPASFLMTISDILTISKETLEKELKTYM